MITLLSRVFIKNKDDKEKLRQSYGMLCSAAGIALNVLLFAIKFIAGTLSGAISVTADAFNNLSDSGSSVITMLGFRLAAKKPDPDHPFGHGRIEYLSGIAVSILIVVMGVELLTGSVQKILHPEQPEISLLVFAVLAVSVAVKLYMFAYNRKYGKMYSSAAMLATSTDSLSDCISTGVVFLSMLFTYLTHINIDAYCGLAVSLFILYAGGKSAYETIQPLLGQPPEKEFVDSIEELVTSFPTVTGVHDLVVHDYGPGRRMITLHAEVPAEGDILEIHDEIDNIERELYNRLNCFATIHMDPVQTENEEVNALKTLAVETCAEIDGIIKLHDFRTVIGATHINLIFDVVVPFKYRLTDDALRKEIAERIRAKNKKLCCVITVDKDFVSGKQE